MSRYAAYFYLIVEFFRSANRPATVVFIGALGLLLLMALPVQMDGIYIENPFARILMSMVVVPVLQSIIASYIFYLLVIHLKDVRDRKTISPYLCSRMGFVVSYCDQQLSAISSAANVPLNLANLSSDDLLVALSKINLHGKAPIMIGEVSGNWEDYFHYHTKMIKECISDIFQKIVYLEPEESRLVALVVESTHIKSGVTIRRFMAHNKNLHGYTGTFFHYCIQCRNLKQYIELNRCKK